MKEQLFQIITLLGIVGGITSTVNPSMAATVNFNSDTSGNKSNGFTSVDSPLVTFSDSSGADLQISNYGAQSDGQGLGVFGDDASKLIFNFTQNVGFLSFQFGNDDPSFAVDGDLAVLEILANGVLTNTVSVALNRDDILNQSIFFSGAAFDSARFFYANSDRNAINLIEIVDNVEFREAIPTPALLPGLIGLGAAAWRKRRNAATAEA
jgi:hypothetical protein